MEHIANGKHLARLTIFYMCLVILSFEYLYQTSHVSTMLVEQDTGLPMEYTVNGVTCKNLPDIRKKDFAKDHVIHNIPDGMLKNRETPRSYPTCDTINPWLLANASDVHVKYQHKWIITLVKSAPQNIRRRNAIRRTWAGIRGIHGKEIFTVFVIAKTDDVSEQSALEQENKVFGDMVQCEFKDSYNNLPLKVLSMMGWYLSSDIDSEFIIITDDDVVLKMPTIYNFFSGKESQHDDPHAYCGFSFSANSEPIRGKSKWRMTESVYPGRKYPAFCNGPNYSMTKSLMRQLFCAASVTDYDGFYLEDVLITGIIREKLNKGNSNIEWGGSFIQYFYNQAGGVHNMIEQTWRKWISSESSYKEMVKAQDTVIDNADKDMENIVSIEKFWDK